MSTMTTKSRLFIDLDGTVARFYDASPNYLKKCMKRVISVTFNLTRK